MDTSFIYLFIYFLHILKYYHEIYVEKYLLTKILLHRTHTKNKNYYVFYSLSKRKNTQMKLLCVFWMCDKVAC